MSAAQQMPLFGGAVMDDDRTKALLNDVATDAETVATVEALRAARPRTRGECKDGQRPCPWISCRHHLYLEASEEEGITIRFPNVSPDALDSLKHTCALDVADEGAHGPQEVADILGVSIHTVMRAEAATLEYLESDDDLLEFRHE